MGTITVAGKTIEVDEEGFLWHRSDWSAEVAEALARLDDFELMEDHWVVINLLREYYDEYQSTPDGHRLIKAIGRKLGPDKGNREHLCTLFPDGPFRQACRYAGIPRPTITI